MSAGPLTVRCPACGQGLRVVLAPGPATQWFPCPSCHRPVPVAAPRSPSPLYTWEVVPGLYPALPPPRRPRFRPARLAAVALVLVTLLSLLLASALAVYGWQASAPESFTVSGYVETSSGGGPPQPIVGAHVLLAGEGGFRASATTSVSGAFRFTGVPSGGVNLTASAVGYANATLATFVSPVYDAGSSGLVIGMDPASSGNRTVTALSPFPDLETFLATVGGAVVVLVVAAGVAVVGVVRVARPDGAVYGILAGGAGAALPAVVYILALGDPFPWFALGSAVAGGFGAFAIAIEATMLTRGPRAAPAGPPSSAASPSTGPATGEAGGPRTLP